MSAALTLAGVPATVTFQTHTQLVFTLPTGRGLNLSLVLNVSGQVLAPPFTVSYDPPSLVSISPLTGPTGGGTVLVLTGSSMDTSGTVLVCERVATPLAPLSTFWTHSSVSVTVPPGQGLNCPVTLIAVSGLRSNNQTFSYGAPVLSNVLPAALFTSGGSRTLTLSGSNFGLTPTITVGGLSCPITSVPAPPTHFLMYCTVPDGQGINKAVIVSVGGQTSNTFLWSYANPTLVTSGPSTLCLA